MQVYITYYDHIMMDHALSSQTQNFTDCWIMIMTYEWSAPTARRAYLRFNKKFHGLAKFILVYFCGCWRGESVTRCSKNTISPPVGIRATVSIFFLPASLIESGHTVVSMPEKLPVYRFIFSEFLTQQKIAVLLDEWQFILFCNSGYPRCIKKY